MGFTNSLILARRILRIVFISCALRERTVGVSLQLRHSDEELLQPTTPSRLANRATRRLFCIDGRFVTVEFVQLSLRDVASCWIEPWDKSHRCSHRNRSAMEQLTRLT